MQFGEIKQLLDAGFTHDEIMSICGGNVADVKQVASETSPAEPEKTQPVEPETVKPVADTTPIESEQEKAYPDFDKLNATMNQLIKTIQSSNLAHASFGDIKGNIDDAVDKIMSEIIRPERKENK